MESPSGKLNLEFVLKLKTKEMESESILPDGLVDLNQLPIDSSVSVTYGVTCEKKEGHDDSDKAPFKGLVGDESCKKTSEPKVDHESGEKISVRSIDYESDERNLKELLNGESEERALKESSDGPNGDYSKQMVIYDPLTNGGGPVLPALDSTNSLHVPAHDSTNSLHLPAHDSTNSLHVPFVRNCFGQPAKVLSIGDYAAQCAACFKWRLVPTKEKYEEIREKVLEIPFFCWTAGQWRSDVSCNVPEDISQDGSRIWAIDKPNIPRPPAGWERLLRIRARGGTKFADVYYLAPSGKKLRSSVEIQKYLVEHPEYITAGVTMQQFSFKVPRPLEEDYVRKRPRISASYDESSPFYVSEAVPLAWASPEVCTEACTELRLGLPGTPYLRSSSPGGFPFPMPEKKKRTPVMSRTTNTAFRWMNFPYY
ncbi:hypothetical protein SAY87_007376 [Trapa incisa]|uniref:Uncharacterized protein n=1 Tax=Trapa incisa TaxID=236973 RepID=A0AAN7Q163_9MYRT|nr:hypothetical protein SAY87_007376 [Trapa incisa]